MPRKNPKPPKYRRIFKEWIDPITGHFLPGNPSNAHIIRKQRSWKNAEWYQEMLSAKEMTMDITIRAGTPTTNGMETKTRRVEIKTTKDYRTAIFMMLLSSALNGDVSAARELLNRAEAVPKDQLPQKTPNPFDNMTDDEIREQIREYQARKLLPGPADISG